MLEPAPPIVRYEHPEPGDMHDLDNKKLGRFPRPGHRVTGDRTQNSSRTAWEFVHVALDDNSRFTCSDIQPADSGRSACRALLTHPMSHTAAHRMGTISVESRCQILT